MIGGWQSNGETGFGHFFFCPGRGQGNQTHVSHMGGVIGVAFCLHQVMTPHTNESDANYMVQSLLIWCNSGLMTMTSGSCVLVSMSRPLSSHDIPDTGIIRLT